ncbi:MFS transporter [Acetivibrio cellulolyticus]|uniref:MFS transporter n=1 Tax=Acetivibrio cellulolyticus TaxID=35830 RepID=UPI0001E3052E|nr:MFS transporter [Acetivibrio cellulolyticus]
MKEKLRPVLGNKKWVIYIMAFLVGIAMGIINPLTTTHMEESNVEGIWIGIISSAYFFLMAFGSIFTDRKMRGKDVRKVIMIGLLMTSVGSAIFPWVSLNLIRLVLMCFMGAGISFFMVGIQTALHNLSDDNNRATVSGLYSLCFAAGFIVSSFTGPMIYERVKWVAFAAGSVCLIAVLIMISLMFNKGLLTIPLRPKGAVFNKIILALLGSFTYGVSETTVVCMYPLFLLRQNYQLSVIGYGLSIFVVGSIIGIMPFSYIADKVGRRKSMAVCVVIAILSIIGIVFADNFAIRMVFSFIAGFVIGPIYPLSMALAVQDLCKEEIPSGTALFTFYYSFGAAAGPFSSSVLMNAFGNKQIFTVSLVLFVALIIYVFVDKKQSQQEPVAV